MKEATGELNMTVITVVAIVAVGAFFYAFVWPVVKNSLDRATKCSDALCAEGCTGSCKCNYVAEDGTETTITCQIKE